MTSCYGVADADALAGEARALELRPGRFVRVAATATRPLRSGPDGLELVGGYEPPGWG